MQVSVMPSLCSRNRRRLNRYAIKNAITTPWKHELTTSTIKFQSIFNGVYHKNTNSFPLSNPSNLRIDLNNTMVIASLKIPSPNTIENNFGNFLDDITSYDAIVSMLQKHAPSSRISHTESSRIEVMSLASRTRSTLGNGIEY